MDFSLTKTKKVIVYAFIIMCAFIVSVRVLLVGYNALFRNYPYKTEANWICEEPHIEFVYSKADNGAPLSKEYLVWNEEVIPIDVSYDPGMYCVTPKGSAVYAERLFTGEWKYRKGTLVFSIKEDFIFGNQYDELIFYRQD